jgi:hypothetical protein
MYDRLEFQQKPVTCITFRSGSSWLGLLDLRLEALKFQLLLPSRRYYHLIYRYTESAHVLYNSFVFPEDRR